MGTSRLHVTFNVQPCLHLSMKSKQGNCDTLSQCWINECIRAKLPQWRIDWSFLGSDGFRAWKTHSNSGESVWVFCHLSQWYIFHSKLEQNVNHVVQQIEANQLAVKCTLQREFEKWISLNELNIAQWSNDSLFWSLFWKVQTRNGT